MIEVNIFYLNVKSFGTPLLNSAVLEQKKGVGGEVI